MLAGVKSALKIQIQTVRLLLLFPLFTPIVVVATIGFFSGDSVLPFGLFGLLFDSACLSS